MEQALVLFEEVADNKIKEEKCEFMDWEDRHESKLEEKSIGRWSMSWREGYVTVGFSVFALLSVCAS
jgi:hypothetical protein